MTTTETLILSALDECKILKAGILKLEDTLINALGEASKKLRSGGTLTPAEIIAFEHAYNVEGLRPDAPKGYFVFYSDIRRKWMLQEEQGCPIKSSEKKLVKKKALA